MTEPIVISHRHIDIPITEKICAYNSGSLRFTAYILDQKGQLYLCHTDSGDVHLLYTLPPETMHHKRTYELTLGHNDRYIAITYQEADNQDFNKGFVIDIRSSTVVLTLDIGDYRTGHTRFPVAFYSHRGRQLILHGTDWNRLDSTDLVTGELLTARDLEQAPEAEEEWDCFSEWNGHIAISSDQTKAACVGWVWHPIGMVFSWNLENWLTSNPFEADVSASKQTFAGWDYFWDSNIVWVDDNRLAIWGGDAFDAGDVDNPHVLIVDTRDDEQRLVINEPENNFYIQDSILIAQTKKGIGLWCCDTGEALANYEGLTLDYYHAQDQEWLSIDSDKWTFTHWQSAPGSQ